MPLKILNNSINITFRNDWSGPVIFIYLFVFIIWTIVFPKVFQKTHHIDLAFRKNVGIKYKIEK